ncbi:hypothetical protein [Streptomyces sp. enrichment culture]|uniref:hypothetical protein n=1 Tax=Streptomyces sp. enrichment culture TaxID=1795815 RepID=UPI003F56A119
MELYEDFFALAWTVGIPSATYLARIQDLIAVSPPSEDETAVLAVHGNGEHVVTDGASAVAEAQLKSTPTRFLRVDYENYSVIWRSPLRYASGYWEPGEAGLIVERIGMSACVAFLRRTATPRIALRAHGIASTFRELGGDLFSAEEADGERGRL